MLNPIKLVFASAVSVAFLAACGGGGGSPDLSDSASSGASPSLGLVQNAAVNFFQADGTTSIGTGDTGTAGLVEINAGSYSGPVIVEVLGDDDDAMYFDESVGSLVAFPAGNSMRALVPNASSTVGVTPLTEIAYQAAVAQNLLPISADAVNELNDIVRAALAPGLNSLLSVPARFDENTSMGSLADDEAGRYALVLAALAELNDGDASPALTTLNALVSDLADGEIDGQNNGSPVAGATWGANFISAMITALNSVASDFGNSELQSNAAAQAPANTQVDTDGVNNGGSGNTGGGDPNGETVAGTVNAAFVGTLDLTYTETNPGAPFTDGQMVQIVVGSDNSLILPGGKTLNNPFYRVFGNPNDAEVIWLDTADNIEYGLSDNRAGTFNEINLGDASNPQSTNGIPGFLGQLRMADDNTAGGVPPELIAIAGQYMGQIVSKSGSFSQGRSLNDMVLVNIDSDGVVTVDSQFVFDPEAEGYAFANNRTNPTESFYRVQAQDGDDSSSFDVIFEDADSSAPIAYRLRQNEALGGGSVRVSTLELEERPLPAAITDFFTTFINGSPRSLTGVSSSQSANSLIAVCEEVSLITDDGGSVNSSNSRTPFRYRLEVAETGSFKDSEIYRRSNTRFSENNGDASLEFTRNRIVLRDDGFVDFINIDIQNAEQARASNDPGEIASAGCGGAMPGDPQAGNQGMSRVVGDGFTGEVNGTEYTLNGDVRLAPNNSGDGFSRLDGVGSDGIRRWRLFVPEMPGTYQCSDDTTDTVLQLLGAASDSGGGSGEGSCTVKVLQGGPIYEGYFTGVFDRGPQQPLATVTNGYYFFDSNEPSDQLTGTLPAGESGFQYRVNGATFHDRPGSVFGNASDDQFGITFGDFPQSQVLNVPNATGTYNCGEGRAFRIINMSIYHEQVTHRSSDSNSSNPPGSSCTINVTQVGTIGSNNAYTGTVEATFSGTFINPENGNSLTVTDGLIRAVGNQGP